MTPLMAVSLVAFLFPLAYSPGPGNMFFATLGARAGVRGAVPALTGYHLATWIVTAAIGLSVGLTLLRDPVVSLTLGVLGGCYVVWLGIKSLMASRRSSENQTADAGPGRETVAAAVPGFWSGLWLLVLNPKAFVIIAVMFTAFLHLDTSTTSDIVWISTIFTLNNLLAFALWAGFGQALAAMVSTQTGRARLDVTFGLGLVAVGCWLFIGAI